MIYRRVDSNLTPDESTGQFNAALVLALFGVLSAIEATNWQVTLAFCTAAAAAATGVGALALRLPKRH